MAPSAILSLEEVRDTPRRAAIRQRRHGRLDHWLDTLEARVKAPQPTLEALTPIIFALRPEWTPAVTEGLVEQRPRAVVAQRTAACPPCWHILSARGPAERTVATLVGASRLRRPSCYGERCQPGTAPLDEVRQRTGRCKPPDVQKAAVQLTQEVPDATACELVQELTGLPLGARTAHAVTQAVAEGLTGLAGAPGRAAILAKIAAVATGPPW